MIQQGDKLPEVTFQWLINDGMQSPATDELAEKSANLGMYVTQYGWK